MEKIDFKEFAVQTYSKVVEESILLYLQSKEAVAALDITPEKEKELRTKIKEISKEIAVEIIEELTKKGAFENKLSKTQEKNIIEKIIEKRVKNEK